MDPLQWDANRPKQAVYRQNSYYRSVRTATMKQGTGWAALDDIEFLVRSDHRVTALLALARRPQSRADLLVMTGVSQSTMGRTLREFDARHWIRREGAHYEATQPGVFVASVVDDLIEDLETELLVRDVWRWLPGESSGFTVEMCADAVVTIPDVENPYRPVNRFRSLLEETERFRFAGFDVALLDPCRDELCKRIVDGMDAEIIDPPGVVQHIRSTCPEQFEETLASGNLTLHLHHDLPSYGVGLLADRVVVSGYDPNCGTVQVLLDTDEPDAREWAESVFETYRREKPTVALEPAVEG